jgi:hypothetical protein
LRLALRDENSSPCHDRLHERSYLRRDELSFGVNDREPVIGLHDACEHLHQRR